MEAVSKVFLHAEKRYAQGHTILGAAIVYRGVVIPYAVRLWTTSTFCQETKKRGCDGDQRNVLGHLACVVPVLESLENRSSVQRVEAVFGIGRLPDVTVPWRSSLPTPRADRPPPIQKREFYTIVEFAELVDRRIRVIQCGCRCLGLLVVSS